jgi:sialate O-acetylesterase
MVAPIVPFTTRGVIWYQGEGNAGNSDEYRVLFPTMIAAWRREWGRADWPFLFVQLAAYGARNGDWPGLRAAQAYARDTVPHSGMALAIDCGEENQIHPRAKQPVGERLARLALAQVYGRTEVVARGPRAERAERTDGRVTVRFAHAAGGLQTSDGALVVPGFEVAGDDGRFRPVSAEIISADQLRLGVEKEAYVTAVRYAWSAWMATPLNLKNGAGLPAEPFKLPVK